MIRGIFTGVLEGVIKRFSATGRSDETFENREYFQHYGFTSRPLSGGEAIIIQEGNQIVAIASDDRRYRLLIAEGEVALYDHLGQYVLLKADGSIQVTAINEIQATAPLVTVVATTKVILDTPIVEATGNIQAHGDILDHSTGTGETMAQMRTVYNSHTHNHPADGVTIPSPNQGM